MLSELYVPPTKGIPLLSDSPKMKPMRLKKGHPAGAVTNKFYSDRQKIEAVTTYLMLGGNASLTAKTLAIPYPTVLTWTQSNWWNDLVHQVQKEEKLQLSARLKKIVEKSWEVVGDRLEKGDWIFNNKTGEILRKPVSMKDAAKVAVDSAVLRDRLSLNEQISLDSQAIEDKLTKLAKAFSDLSKGITNNQAVENIDFKENEGAIHPP